MSSVDVFVLLNHCQFNREHFQHRFKFKDKWYTMSVQDVRHPDLIVNRTYADPERDWERIKNRLPQYKSWFEALNGCISESLWTTNYKLIVVLAKKLGITTTLLRDEATSLTGTDRLVEICRLLGADTYLAGRSGAGYMEPEKFKQAGIKVEYQTVTDTRHIFEA